MPFFPGALPSALTPLTHGPGSRQCGLSWKAPLSARERPLRLPLLQHASGTESAVCSLSDTRDGFMGDNFPTDWGWGDWFRDDSNSLHLLCALFLLLFHQFHLRWSDIRSQRLGTLPYIIYLYTRLSLLLREDCVLLILYPQHRINP